MIPANMIAGWQGTKNAKVLLSAQRALGGVLLNVTGTGSTEGSTRDDARALAALLMREADR